MIFQTEAGKRAEKAISKLIERPERDAEVLNFVADRLVHVYGDKEDVDFVRAVRRIAGKFMAIKAEVNK